jgi:hypothetical protein
MGLLGGIGDAVKGALDTGTGGLAGDAYNYGKGLLGAAGFKAPDGSDLKKDKELYSGAATTAGQTLGQNMAAPEATAPEWLRAGTAMAPITESAASQAGAASAGPVFLNQDQSNAARAGQQSLASILQAQAAGKGPSIAQEQLRQATGANINNQLAAAKSIHGAGRLAAMRNASWTNAATQQAANSQAAGLRAQEIATSQTALGNLLAGQRSQDLGAAAQQAGLTQQTSLANAGFLQNANLTNAQLAQNASQFNAGVENAGGQFNSNAYNNAALAYAGQANAGNQAFGLGNLNANIQTNALNTQRQQDYINALFGSAAGQSGIDSTIYAGNAAYDESKRQIVGGIINQAGKAAIPTPKTV